MLTHPSQQHHAMTLGFEQFFEQIYQNEYNHLYPSPIEFYEQHLYFVTVLLKPNKVSLVDRSGITKRPCFYQGIIDDRQNAWINSQSAADLLDFSVSLKIPNASTLNRTQLISSIAKALAPKHRQLVHSKPHPLEVFGYFHQVISRACLTNYQRKIYEQPFAVAFVDFEGTRRGGCVDPSKSQWPHIHSLIFVRPHQQPFFQAEMHVLQNCFRRSKYEAELDVINTIAHQRRLTSSEHLRRVQLQALLIDKGERFLKGDLNAIHDVDCVRYNRNDGPLSHLIGYSKKGADRVPTQWINKGNRWREATHAGADDLFEIFPKQLRMRNGPDDQKQLTPNPTKDVALLENGQR